MEGQQSGLRYFFRPRVSVMVKPTIQKRDIRCPVIFFFIARQTEDGDILIHVYNIRSRPVCSSISRRLTTNSCPPLFTISLMPYPLAIAR